MIKQHNSFSDIKKILNQRIYSDSKRELTLSIWFISILTISFVRQYCQFKNAGLIIFLILLAPYTIHSAIRFFKTDDSMEIIENVIFIAVGISFSAFLYHSSSQLLGLTDFPFMTIIYSMILLGLFTIKEFKIRIITPFIAVCAYIVFRILTGCHPEILFPAFTGAAALFFMIDHFIVVKKRRL